MINPGSCSGEVVSDTDSNGSRFDDGEHSGEDLCDGGGESDDGGLMVVAAVSVIMIRIAI